MIVAQRPFNLGTNCGARARQVPRGSGLVLAQQASDRGQRQVLDVVEIKTQPIARIELTASSNGVLIFAR